MTTTDHENAPETPGASATASPSGPVKGRGHPSKQSARHRRNQARLRGAICRKRLHNAGKRHAAPLVDALVIFTAKSEKLPWPSQRVLAKVCGVTDRTIRHWLVICEDLGVIEVFRSRPKPDGAGGWTRQTNRYLLCDRRAKTAPIASPVRRRHRPNHTQKHKRKPISSNPTGFEPSGGATDALAPITGVVEDPVEVIEQPTAAILVVPDGEPASSVSEPVLDVQTARALARANLNKHDPAAKIDLQ